MYFVNKQHVVGLQSGKDGRNVAGAFHGRAGGNLDAGAHFVGDNVGEGSLAEAGRPVDGDMVQGFASHTGGLHCDGQVFPHLGLPYEILQPGRAQAGVLLLVVLLRRRRYRTHCRVGCRLLGIYRRLILRRHRGVFYGVG